MLRSIGIVGCSAEGAALCYRTICTEAPLQLGGHHHPPVAMHTHSLQRYVDALERDDLDAVAALMLDSAQRLAAAGAELLICPDNTIHQAMDLVRPRSPLPWLHIAEVVAAEARHRGLRRLGILGTRWLVASEVYPRALAAAGLQAVRPSNADRDTCSHIIMDELVRGVVTPAGTAQLVALTQRLAEAGCDAVVLGCTELPLVLSDVNSALPVLDSTRLLARAALAAAMRSGG
ncbi:MAG: amino acid racemase [Rubrivivax sp.]|nr:amino acid racemase [Rubrivivax sp.]